MQDRTDIRIHADGSPPDFPRASRLPLVDAGIGSVRVLGCHLPERIFDDDRGVIAYA